MSIRTKGASRASQGLQATGRSRSGSGQPLAILWRRTASSSSVDQPAVAKAAPGDHYGDVEVDTTKSMEVYREWVAKARMTRKVSHLRRPLHFARAVKPAVEAYAMPGS